MGGKKVEGKLESKEKEGGRVEMKVERVMKGARLRRGERISRVGEL